jgi:hypothetical protein
MTLCLGQLKKYFGRLLLVFCMLLVGVSTGLTSASASDGEHFAWSDNSWGYDNPNFQGTITSGTDQVLFCFYRQSRNNDNAPYIAFNGDNLTTYKTLDYDAGKYRFAYLVNPDVGTYSITNPSGGYISAVRCVVKENVSQSQPVNYATDWIASSNSSYGYTMASSSTSILLNYGGYNNTGNTFDNLDFFDGGSAVGQGTTHYVASWGTDNATSTFWISPLSNTEKVFTITEVNKALPEPVSSDYVYITDFNSGGSDPINILNQPVNFDYIYDFCDSYDFNNDYVAVYEVNGVEISREQISSSDCSTFQTGLVYDAVSLATSTGTSTLSIYSMAYTLNEPIIDEPLENLTLVASSQEFYSIVDTTARDPYVSPRFSPYNIQVNSATSTINFIYDYCRASYKDDVEKICLEDEGSTCFEPVLCYGSASVDIPSGNVGSQITRNFGLLDSADELLFVGESFAINFISPRIDTPNVCASSTTWYSEQFCNLSEDFMKPFFYSLGDGLTLFFPFSFIKDISTAWDKSETASLPNDLTFLPFPNADGNLILTLPDRYSGGSAVGLCVFGNCIFEKTTALTSFFQGMRGLSFYLIWAIFIFAIYKFAQHLYKDLTN